MKLYCLSGLGVDERAFVNFKIPEVELIHISWIPPIPNETLKDYSRRLFNSVEIDNNYSLIGVSFGGMIAQEFAKLRKPNKLFLVSTIRNRNQIRTIFKIGGYLGLNRLIPKKLLTKSNSLTNWLFSVSSKEEKQLLKEILHDTDPKFISWAIQAILKWDNMTHFGNRIHGNNDRILPCSRDIDYVINGGGHFMIVSNGDQISEIINEIGV